MDLPSISQNQWDDAGKEGYQFARNGADGLYSALDILFEPYKDHSQKGGPQAVFGRLYQWLQFRSDRRDAGPMRQVLRNYILDHMAIGPGTRLLGQVVEES